MVGLYGRALPNELVRESLRRSEDNLDAGRGRHPVLLFEGVPGSGRTAYLKSVVDDVTGRIPHAYVDLAEFGKQSSAATVPQLLAELAFQMGSYCELYGELRFPRLVVGHVVMRVALDKTNLSLARGQIAEALRAHRGVDKVSEFLSDVAEGALSHVPGPIAPSANLVGRVVDLSVGGLTSHSPLRRYILGPYQLWYGGHDVLPAGTASKAVAQRSVNVLIRLNRWAHDGGPANQEAISALLWRAFLADLQDNFAHGHRSDEWPCNAVVVLDNADTELGREFLGDLVDRRWLGEREPLTIVAAGGTGLSAALGDDVAVPLIRDVGETGADGVPVVSWLRCPLRDLGVDDVVSMISGPAMTPADALVWADELHQFTAGHPGVTRLLADAIPPPAERAELVSLLALPHGKDTVGDELLRVVLGGPVRDEVLDHFARCSVARSRADGDLLAAGSEDPLLVDLPAGLWSQDPAGEPTLLRRMLLRRFVDGEPRAWTSVHQQLRRRGDRRRDDLVGQLYYRLASNDPADVTVAVQRLADLLVTMSVADWLALVRSVCWAPPGGESTTPEAYARTVLAAIGAGPQPFTVVARIVTRLRIAADPLCGHDRRLLYQRLVQDLIVLSGLDEVHDDTGELGLAITHYRDKTTRYEHRPARRVAATN